MRFLLTFAAMFAFAAQSFADDGFYVVRRDDPLKSVDIASADGSDVQIIGPWHNGRTVLYETLTAPTRQEIRYFLAKSKKTWEESQAASPKSPSSNADGNSGASVDALDEVNRQRAARRLRPYIRDDHLSVAAAECAAYRAARGISGHTGNDFSFVPSGGSSSCAGCAAWESGFGACAIFDNYTYAGAAYVRVGGINYCHVFYR